VCEKLAGVRVQGGLEGGRGRRRNDYGERAKEGGVALVPPAVDGGSRRSGWRRRQGHREKVNRVGKKKK
jgi:hypothetical protein